MSEWKTIDTAPEGVEVMTKIDDQHGERNVTSLVKRTRIPGETSPLFWVPDGSMYVYYEPTHWRPLNHTPAPREIALSTSQSDPAPTTSSGVTYTQAECDEMCEIAERDGYEKAAQEIDQKTGGDGEYRYCLGMEDSDRHTPDAPAMIQRIVDRFEVLNLLDEATKTGSDQPDDLPAPEIAALAQDVINLVIAAREAFNDPEWASEEWNALDKALEAFSSRVPYENEPDAAPEQEEAK